MIRTIDEYIDLLISDFGNEDDDVKLFNDMYKLEESYYVKVKLDNECIKYVTVEKGQYQLVDKRENAIRLTKEQCVELAMFIIDNYDEDAKLELEA